MPESRVRVLLFGATGMVGGGALLECLADDRVASVVSVARRSTGVVHPKLREIIHHDFFGYAPLHDAFADVDACLFCLGVSSVGKGEAEYTHLTYDLTLAAARAMVAVRPAMTFCFVSGAGTDSTERSRIMWTRVKGRTENALLALPFRAAYMFRPGYIQPMKGVRSSTSHYQLLYTLARPLYPLVRRLAPRRVTNTEALGRALVAVAVEGFERRILDGDDINRLGAAGERRPG